jgi:hypothetical protein
LFLENFLVHPIRPKAGKKSAKNAFMATTADPFGAQAFANLFRIRSAFLRFSVPTSLRHWSMICLNSPRIAVRVPSGSVPL